MGADKPLAGAQPLQVDEEMARAMRMAGASEAEIAEVVAERGRAPERRADADDFEVEPDNWESWTVFTALATQWHWVAVGLGELVRMGLKHEVVTGERLRLLGVRRKRWAQVYEDLRLIERTVLAAENEMRARRPRKGRR